MNKTAIGIALCASLAGINSVNAGSLEDRLLAMEKRLQYLENRVQDQDLVIKEKDKTIKELKTNSAWVSNVEIGGLIEVEAQNVSADSADDTSDIYLATAELAINATLHDWVSSELVLLYEDDGSHSGEFNVDTAAITIADPDSSWALTAGQFVVPFGTYETNLLSDPLTLEMGETPDAAVMASYEDSGFNVAAYVFNGVSDVDASNKINDYGFTAGYAFENENSSVAIQFGYMNNLGNTDGIAIGDMVDDVPAWTASVMAEFASFALIAEYLTATDQFDVSELGHNGNGAEPKAWNAELAYSFDNITIAAGLQGTEEASALDLPEEKKMIAMSVGLFENTSFTLEFANEEAYDGSDSNVFTGQLAYEF